MRARTTATVALAIGLIGIGLVLHGLWIPAKARVAQFLLTRAWHEAERTGVPVKAWSWADSWPVAELTLDHRRLIVLSAGGGESLAFGPAHVAGSAMPGAPGVSIIAGHRDTHFAGLGKLKPGSWIGLSTSTGGRMAFRVSDVHVLDSSWIDVPLGVTEPVLLLTSCWPLDGSALHPRKRYVVVAEQVRDLRAAR